jgi:hypothetical protein
VTAPITSGQNPALEITPPSGIKKVEPSLRVAYPVKNIALPNPTIAPPICIALVACVEDVQQRRVIAQVKIMLFLKIRFFMIIL